jgi:hypothetical protein
MSTVSQLVDRTYREWLNPAREAPVLTRLDGALEADSDTLTYRPFPAPEDSYAMTTGVVVQVERELMWVATSSTEDRTAVLARGYQGTTPAAHPDGAWLEVSPQWPWQTVYDAACDEVADLWPMLFTLRTETITADEATYPLDRSDLGWVINAVGADGYSTNAWFNSFGDEGSGTLVFPYYAGTADYTVTFSARIPRPGAPEDNLAALGVRPEWERIVGLGAAAYLVGSADLDRASLESITESIESETTPVGSYVELQSRLLRVRDYLMVRAHDALLASLDTTTQVNRVV